MTQMGIGFIKTPGVQKVTVTVTAQTGGTATGGGTYKKKQTVTLKATNNIGYHFVGWYSNGIQLSTNANYTFTVTASVTIQARFAINTYTVTVTNGSGGGTYRHGDQCTVTAAVPIGHHFTSWSNGATSNPYTFTVTGNIILTANVAPNVYTITVTNGSGGGQYAYGSQCTVTANVPANYKFSSWSNGVTSNPYTFTVTGNVTLTASFVPDPVDTSVSFGYQGGCVNYSVGIRPVKVIVSIQTHWSSNESNNYYGSETWTDTGTKKMYIYNSYGTSNYGNVTVTFDDSNKSVCVKSPFGSSSRPVTVTLTLKY